MPSLVAMPIQRFRDHYVWATNIAKDKAFTMEYLERMLNVLEYRQGNIIVLELLISAPTSDFIHYHHYSASSDPRTIMDRGGKALSGESPVCRFAICFAELYDDRNVV
jgi:hypothetical protein